MYARLKTNLIGLAVAVGALLAGFGLGEPPSAAYGSGHVPMAVESVLEGEPAVSLDTSAHAGRRGALKRHIGLPFFSLAARPRQES